MFTGIVEETGSVQDLSLLGSSGRIKIQAKKVLEGTKVGDSIAVNGICLTVTTLLKDSFTADVMAETIRRSSLKEAKPGTKVNLERAMAADGRFGGHIVSGHVDGCGTVTEILPEENAVWFTIKAKKEILKLIVEKGSVCLDGISLTVADVNEEEFKVSVIPHTRQVTTLYDKKPGSMINIETDVIGKYVERLLKFKDAEKKETEPSSKLTMEFLEKYGI